MCSHDVRRSTTPSKLIGLSSKILDRLGTSRNIQTVIQISKPGLPRVRRMTRQRRTMQMLDLSMLRHCKAPSNVGPGVLQDRTARLRRLLKVRLGFRNHYVSESLHK